MHKLLIFTLLFIATHFFGQFATVIDKDGSVHMRHGANVKSKIIGKIKSGEVVYVFRQDKEFGNWVIVDYYKKDGNLLTGYIHRSRLQMISEYELVPSAVTSDSGVNFILRDIRVVLKSENFDYDLHRKVFSKTKYVDYEIEDRYKGQQIWGTDGTIPETHYKSITVAIADQMIKIPEREIENLFNINNENAYCYFDALTETLYLTSMNSDGAGTYDILFIIKGGKYFGRYIYGSS